MKGDKSLFLTLVVYVVATSILVASPVYNEDISTSSPLHFDIQSIRSIQNPKVRLERIRELERRERKREAMVLLEEWLEAFPDHPDARSAVITLSEVQTDLDRFIVFTRKLIVARPDSRAARFSYFKLGETCLLKGETTPALSAFSDFLCLNPSDPMRPKALYYLARCLMSLDKYDKAIEALDDLRRHHPDFAHSPDIFDAVSTCCIELGQTREAARSLRFIISKFPNYSYLPRCHLSLGLCYEDLGNYQSARGWYTELVRLFPKSLESGLAEIRLKDIESTHPLPVCGQKIFE